ncbi:site-2 protease family protein [Varunaivibrio sulfuroxidans]|uniref:Zn-dependent protease n=1 Tax=Varunaivibrio sulfuroxidans TaxID=1773489 RepID=A0A4R3J7J0_9PROT|nr:site-2 protease family protein [Varunaivibrio sulfuroxidans]TCS61325.1 Zn-dependent protease [Varunaivibrio sulfuroxidans]WES31062.1 site-2 protease family protein [Varunaivibrio sulfuroxidans]
MGLTLNDIVHTASVWVLPVLFAVTLHEAAHGFIAWRLGDPTAYRAGRVTFNPLRHVDPFGTVILPAMLLLASGGKFMFGFAKPVPVNFRALGHPRRDMVLVALAGPGTNILLAVVSALLLHTIQYMPPAFAQWSATNFVNSMWINIVLALFNMIPLPPLDGGRVAVGVLPQPFSSKLAGLERSGFLILLAILFVLPWLGRQIGVNLDILPWVIGEPARALMSAIASVTGVQ